MPRRLILGWGNPLRGDDGFGFAVAERLRELLPEDEAEVLALHQLTPELIENVSRAGEVIFIDASAQGEPGRLAVREVSPSTQAEAFTHRSTPAGLLAAARSLYGTTPPAVLYTVGGVSFEFGEGLSETMRRAVDEVVERLRC